MAKKEGDGALSLPERPRTRMNQVDEIASGWNLATSAFRRHGGCPMVLNAVFYHGGCDISVQNVGKARAWRQYRWCGAMTLSMRHGPFYVTWSPRRARPTELVAIFGC